MAQGTVFGRLKLGKTGRGENPNGEVSVTSNGDYVDGRGADGEDYVFGRPREGARWNRTYPKAKLGDFDVARPVITASRFKR